MLVNLVVTVVVSGIGDAVAIRVEKRASCSAAAKAQVLVNLVSVDRLICINDG
jgi:hypothetical protein